MLFQIAIVVLLLVAVAMIALILLQQGKGAGMGASFGAGASNTVFGSVGSGNFLTRSTWFLIFVFFGICLLLGYLQKSQHEQVSNFSNIEETSEQAKLSSKVTQEKLNSMLQAQAISMPKTSKHQPEK